MLMHVFIRCKGEIMNLDDPVSEFSVTSLTILRREENMIQHPES